LSLNSATRNKVINQRCSQTTAETVVCGSGRNYIVKK